MRTREPEEAAVFSGQCITVIIIGRGMAGGCAGRTLGNPNASALQRSLADSALSQSCTGKVTSRATETKVSSVIENPNSLLQSHHRTTRCTCLKAAPSGKTAASM